jgi:hypothetical protein
VVGAFFEYCLYALQVVNVITPDFVVILNLLNPLSTDQFNQVYPEFRYVAR